MANINFTRLFTTLGYLCGGLNETNTFAGTTVVNRGNTLATQFDALAVYAPLVSTIPVTEVQTVAANSNSWTAMLSNFAQAAIINETLASNPAVGSSFSACLTELVRQMLVNSQTLTATQSNETTTAVGSPTGDESFVFGLYNPVTGAKSDAIIPDTWLIKCSLDQSHGGTAYRETFSIQGYPLPFPLTNYQYGTAGWGAGVSTSVSAVDPAINGGVTTDPGFAQWTAVNTPTQWPIYSGTAGTNVFQATNQDPRADGGSSLSLVGDGSTVVKVRQAVTLTPGVAYSLNYRVYMKTDESSHWQVSVSLTNAAGTAVTGPASYSNVVTSTSSASLAANWTNVFNGTIIPPAVIPSSGLFLEIRLCINGTLTSPAQAGANAYVDYVSLVAQNPVYSGGPALTIFSGQTAAVQGDTRTAAFSLATETITGSLLIGINRLVGGLAQYYPVSIPTVTSGATQSDSLVT